MSVNYLDTHSNKTRSKTSTPKQSNVNNKKSGAFHEKDITEPLLNIDYRKKELIIDNFGIWYNILRYLGCLISKEQRLIYLNGDSRPKTFC